MALVWIEGFEGFGDSGSVPSPTNIMGRKYTMSDEASMYIAPGRTSGLCIRISDHGDWIKSGVLTTDSTMIIGFAFKLTVLPMNTQGELVRLYDGATAGMLIKVQPISGYLQVYRGATLLSTSTQSIILNRWYYLEFKVVCSDTGSYELRMDNVPWISDAGPVDTREGDNSYHTAFMLMCPYNFLSVYYDDLYVLDGTTGLNTFLGPQRVIAVNPDGDDTVTWDHSAGATNYEVIDDGTIVDNTDYVYTSTLPEQDLYGYESVPSGVSIVNGIQIITETNMDSGIAELALVVKSSTTVSVGPAIPVVTGSEVTHSRVVEEDPDASAPWTETTLNAAKFGIKVTA